MPHLVEMDKKLSKKGLRLIGAHCQNATDDEIVEFCEGKKVEFPIVTGANSPVQFSGIPRMFVFDVEGTLVYSGHPNGAEDVIKKELRRVTESGESGGGDSTFAKPVDLVTERQWTNTKGQKLTATLMKLEGSKGLFRKPNGTTFTYDITQLSDDDQTLIKEATAKPADEEAEAEDAEDEDL